MTAGSYDSQFAGYKEKAEKREGCTDEKRENKFFNVQKP